MEEQLKSFRKGKEIFDKDFPIFDDPYKYEIEFKEQNPPYYPLKENRYNEKDALKMLGHAKYLYDKINDNTDHKIYLSEENKEMYKLVGNIIDSQIDESISCLKVIETEYENVLIGSKNIINSSKQRDEEFEKEFIKLKKEYDEMEKQFDD